MEPYAFGYYFTVITIYIIYTSDSIVNTLIPPFWRYVVPP